jgi:hypothetical protein
MIYEKYEVVSNDNPHLYAAASEYWSPSLEDLLVYSREGKGAMNPLTTHDVRGHSLGCSMVGTWYDLPFADHQGVLSYAAITGREEFQGKICAVIGGVIVHPSVRRVGVGTLTVDWLVKTASTKAFQMQWEHEAYIARCNTLSAKLFAALDFIEVQEEESKTIMFKSLVQ